MTIAPMRRPRPNRRPAFATGSWVWSQSVPEPAADGTVPLQTVVSGVLDFLDRHTARSNALDHRAAAALQDHIGELRALGPFSCGLAASLRFIRERVQSLHVAAERPRPGHLYACTLSQSGYAGRPYLFVVGLEEGRVFSSSTEDAVLLDTERAGDFRRPAPVHGQDRRSRVCGADPARRVAMRRSHSATPVGTRESFARPTPPG